MNLEEMLIGEKVERPVEVVRVKRSFWIGRDRSLNMTTKITRLARKSSGHEFLSEEAQMIGVDEVFANIVNLHECEDGLYIVGTVNECASDWEMPNIIDCYDYKLYPYEEKPTQKKDPPPPQTLQSTEGWIIQLQEPCDQTTS